MTRSNAPVLIIGGAGFVGTNLASRLVRSGIRVRVLDNFSRPGTEKNAAWLEREHGRRVEIRSGDVRDAEALDRAVDGAAGVFHLAAQVAVTTSLLDPAADFEVNAAGTLRLLEALRRRGPIPLVFTSTNKVYGDLDGIEVVERRRRWDPRDPELRARGFSEAQPLAFASPYGCSKGAADQYVLDYARSFGVPAVTLRMSCIYGPHQFGTEDQGWVAHFLIRSIAREPITIYGDGKQVRDLLYVDDLVEALSAAADKAHRLAGRAFNIGGTPVNSASLLELCDEIEALQGERPSIRFGDRRAGDQLYYTSDVSAFASSTGWAPRVGVSEGVRRLYRWLLEHRPELRREKEASCG